MGDIAVAADAGHRRANRIDALVGDRVRVRRLVLGMSQEKLAIELDLTFQQIQKYEKGINRICASRLFELAKALGVPVQYFYEEVVHRRSGGNDLGDTAAETQILHYLRSREGLALNKGFLRIRDARTRRAIVELVRILADRALPDTRDPDKFMTMGWESRRTKRATHLATVLGAVLNRRAAAAYAQVHMPE